MERASVPVPPVILEEVLVVRWLGGSYMECTLRSRRPGSGGELFLWGK